MVEIADAMGCSQGAVKSHLHRARESLKDALAAWTEEER
jgi:DNA-directed RNA polymerase specialized sigma24 family protein